MTPAVKSFERSLSALNASGEGWLQTQRAEAFARFLQLGLPTTRNEEWTYTNLAPISGVEFAPAPAAPNFPSALVDELVGPAFGHRLVFLNGRFVSGGDGLPPTVRVTALGSALLEKQQWLCRAVADQGRALTALNAALSEDGAFIHLPKGVVVAQPIELVFIQSGKSVAVHPRNVIVAEESAQATVMESYVSLDASQSLTNAVTEVFLGPNSQLSHYRLQSEAADAFHLGLVQVSQERDSRFISHSVQVGAQLGRHEVRVTLGAQGAQTTLHGLYMGRGKQLLDNHTVVDHAQPNCSSREIFKGILADHSHGVFNGKVVVRENAVQTDSSQVNKNLILSEGALADTRPQLEILADDVKCTHGAAIGRLDEKALFYLRSRGIPESLARNLLTYAFASEMVSLIELPSHRERMQKLVKSRLPDGERLGAVA